MTSPLTYLPNIFIQKFKAKSKMRKRLEHLYDRNKPTAFLIGFSSWKYFMKDFLSNYNVIFLGHGPDSIKKVDLENINMAYRPTVFLWSYKCPRFVEEFLKQEQINFYYVEDGFLRSFGLGAMHIRPLSLIYDRHGMHFDGERATELEALISDYDFSGDLQLKERAEKLQAKLIEANLSKYNFLKFKKKIHDFIDIKHRQDRILVVGQVEDDLSIQYGMDKIINNNELVIQVADEFPKAQIIYRPHPESVKMAKAHYSRPADVAYACDIVPTTLPLSECIEAVDHVVTMTSLAGFEAAMRGKTVTVLGTPFYAGWGFTEDRMTLSRRRTNRTVGEVLAAAYILYAKYYHPVTGQSIEVEDVVRILEAAAAAAAREQI